MLYTIYSFTVSNVVYIMCKCYIFPSTDAEESSLPFSHVNFHFLNEDDLFDDEAGVEGFYIVSKSVSFYLYARLCAGYSRSIIRQKSNFPIKEQKGKTALPFLTRYNSTSSHSFFVI